MLCPSSPLVASGILSLITHQGVLFGLDNLRQNEIEAIGNLLGATQGLLDDLAFVRDGAQLMGTQGIVEYRP